MFGTHLYAFINALIDFWRLLANLLTVRTNGLCCVFVDGIMTGLSQRSYVNGSPRALFMSETVFRSFIQAGESHTMNTPLNNKHKRSPTGASYQIKFFCVTS